MRVAMLGFGLCCGLAPSGGAAFVGETFFRTADQCMACHNGLTTPAGEDVSIGSSWRTSMMANSARDPYWQAAVRREVMDHPESQAAIEAECSRCHMPMAARSAEAAGSHGSVFDHLTPAAAALPAGVLAADGVSCTVCHQIQADALGTRESFNGHFAFETQITQEPRAIFGPYAVDAGRSGIMHSAVGFRPIESAHIQQSEMCATCHTLTTSTLDPQGQVIGSLPEQAPYLEWLHSDYRETMSCQTCHMPVVDELVPISSVWGEPRTGMSRHQFRGGNFFMMRMLNRYRNELGVQALPQEMEAAVGRTIAHLQSETAALAIERVEVAGGTLRADLRVENLAGHKLPTAYPSRRVWLHVTVTDRNAGIVFESGAFQPNGSIAGNDNDADGSRYERHHDEIRSSDDVQIYEAIMTDRNGQVTTGLLSGRQFVKDNRILPQGFDKHTAPSDVAVQGNAQDDADFGGGGDRVRYAVDVSNASGPFTVTAELWFQPIAYRWAHNLRDYDAMETNRFTGYYEAMSSASAVVLTRAVARSP
jgi:hypothetical protein